MDIKQEFRDFLVEAGKGVIVKGDLSDVKSDKDAYYDLHKIMVDDKNKLILMTNYYGNDKETLKHQDKLDKEFKKYKKTELLYMFDDKDNKYRNTLFKID